MMILCVDPGGKGGHTGIVLLEANDSGVAVLDSCVVPGGVYPVLEWLAEQEIEDWSVVVVEHFVNRGVGGADITPAYTEGAIQGFLEARKWVGDIILSPASGKNEAVPDAVVSRLVSKKSFSHDHHQDRWEALRHGLRYLKRSGHLPTIRQLWPND